jgi:D-glycero-D-manno-heptose 1,7-bisphosphate phosphatase
LASKIDQNIHLIFDRDGTLIEDRHYLSEPAQISILPDVIWGLQALKNAGFHLYIHSNQSGVSRGYFSKEQANICMSAFLEILGVNKDFFNKICISYGIDHKTDIYRKPSPFFANKIMKRNKCEPSSIYYIGDRITDLQTAYNSGCLGLGVNTGPIKLKEVIDKYPNLKNFPIFNSFREVVEHLLNIKCLIK